MRLVFSYQPHILELTNSALTLHRPVTNRATGPSLSSHCDSHSPWSHLQSSTLLGSVTLAAIKRLSVPVLVVNSNSLNVQEALRHHCLRAMVSEACA
jgi:hypothetical protein